MRKLEEKNYKTVNFLVVKVYFAKLNLNKTFTLSSTNSNRDVIVYRHSPFKQNQRYCQKGWVRSDRGGSMERAEGAIAPPLAMVIH